MASDDLYPRYDYRSIFVGNFTDANWEIVKWRYFDPYSSGIPESPIPEVITDTGDVYGVEGQRRQKFCPNGTDLIWQQYISGRWVDVSACPEWSGVISYIKGEGESPSATEFCKAGLEPRFDWTLLRDVCKPVYVTPIVEEPYISPEAEKLGSENILFKFLNDYWMYILAAIIIMILMIFVIRR